MKKSGADLPRPYKCPICDKAFYRLEHQTRHIRTHTGEKPHVCTFPGCAKRFSRSDELTRHLRIHSNPNSRRNQRKDTSPQSQTAATSAVGNNQPPGSSGAISNISNGSSSATVGAVKTPQPSPPSANTPLMFSAPTSPNPQQPSRPGMPAMNRTSSSASINVGSLGRWPNSQSQFDIHALANTATQVLEQERRMMPGGGSSNGSITPHGGSQFNRQRSTPALASYFHHHAQLGPYERPSRSTYDPLSNFHSNTNTVPNSPAVSRPNSPSPDSTPLATPGHSPHLAPQDVQLPAIRSLPLSRFHNTSGNVPPPHPIEPTPQSFSGIRGSLDMPAFNLSGPATPLTQSPNVSRPSSPPPPQRSNRVAVSDLVNPKIKIEN